MAARALPKPVFAANWKMHHGPTATREFVTAFKARVTPRPDRTIVFFPPAVSLEAFRQAAADRPDLVLGTQDVHPEDEGACTGAVSAPMAKDAGARFALVGHSERRQLFGDTDAIVAGKLRAVLRHGLVAVLCVGETLDQREDGRAEETVAAQLHAALGDLEPAALETILVAYEPVWAIGTGRNARAEDAAAMHRFVRAWVAGRAGEGIAREMRVLYGGSVTPENIRELLVQRQIDGVLVGGASLKVESFAAICAAG